MKFNKYQHVERWGNSEVRDIEFGECHIFPKLDGTYASAWMQDGVLCAGSRNRKLAVGADNAGFLAYMSNNFPVASLLTDRPDWHLYGEWLVPHALKGYADEAWNKFYVFDVLFELHPGDEDMEADYTYVEYDEYMPVLRDMGIEFVPRIAKLIRPTYQEVSDLAKTDRFLLRDDFEGCGEGVVVKNYEFNNKYGRRTWAKIVNEEFKENKGNPGPPGTPKERPMVEGAIADKYVTKALCDKVKAKIENEVGDWSSKYIGRLLQTVFYDIVREESWSFVKEHKFPIIDFKTLRSLINDRVKRNMPELF
jgi:hypothetical protein